MRSCRSRTLLLLILLHGGTNLSQWADFREWYVQYLAPVGIGPNIQTGQINSVIGYEMLESPHNANYSRS
ncbi:MAG: outer membrane beta-barrel protein [Nitrospira sp.]|nr:outer membrane beta-barrel protein [Nitrospira sp.]